MTLPDYLSRIECPMFASRDNLPDALNYATEIARSTDNPMAVLTAVYVVLNTAVADIRKLEGVAVDPPPENAHASPIPLQAD